MLTGVRKAIQPFLSIQPSPLSAVQTCRRADKVEFPLSLRHLAAAAMQIFPEFVLFCQNLSESSPDRQQFTRSRAGDLT